MYRILARSDDFFFERLGRWSLRTFGGCECIEFLPDRMIFFANVSKIRGPSFSERRMFRIFGHPDAILSECFECCFGNRRTSRAKSLSIAEFKISTHSRPRNVRSDQRPKHSSKKSSDRAKIQYNTFEFSKSLIPENSKHSQNKSFRRAKIRYIREFYTTPKRKNRNIRQKYRPKQQKLETFEKS